MKYGEAHMHDEVKIDYFAVSLPDLLIWEDDLNKKNNVDCNYLRGLGYLGLGKMSKSTQEFNKILEQDSCHIGALIHKKFSQDN